jgi:carboxylesterase
LLHGFTATPGEVRSLAEALAHAGFPVRAVRLAGHGTSVADLAQTTWHDWLASAAAGFDRLRREAPRVAVAGVSMGGLLALRLAATRPADVAALTLCAPALRLADWRPRVLPFVRWVPGLSGRFAVMPKRGGRDILDHAARARSCAYDAIPLPAVLSLLQLQRLARRDARAVTQPTLLLHGRQDHVVPVASQERLRRTLRSTWVESHVLDDSAHVLTEDAERDAVGRLAVDFLDRVEHQEAT